VGEGESHDSAGDTPVSRAEQSGRIELFCRVKSSGTVAKRARPLLFAVSLHSSGLQDFSFKILDDSRRVQFFSPF
jgi:hypothetical protein